MEHEIKKLRHEIEQMKRRQWETLPTVMDSAPTVTQSDRKAGVNEQGIYLSAGVVNLIIRVNGVAWRFQGTSAF